jgi:ATP-dependent Clp protease ATP-binding subunit ClpA
VFERYTEKARRVIFFSRYEASQFGSPYIETEHLLLGLLREDKVLTNRILRGHRSMEGIRKTIEENTIIRDKVSTSVDLPLSNESKRILAYAAQEAERLSQKHVGTEHLLLGMLREEKSFAATLLADCGVRLETVRKMLAGQQVDLTLEERRTKDRPREERPDPARMLDIEFVDEKGVALFRLPWTFSIMLPRTGEYVMFPDDAIKGEFRVERVTYHYQRVSGESTLLKDRLAKIEITLTKVENDASAETP